MRRKRKAKARVIDKDAPMLGAIEIKFSKTIWLIGWIVYITMYFLNHGI